MRSNIIDMHDIIEKVKANDGRVGLVSDGYHTFDELYEHRMFLFACLVANNENAWKSRLHDDGTMYDHYFIVGIDTAMGQATYHYHMENWDNFKCKEIDNAPKWDGHTPTMVLERLAHEYGVR